MAKEIERKFLVCRDDYRSMSVRSNHIVQGYVNRDPDATVRVRIIDNNQAFITIKSRNIGAERDEWEYAIPVDDANDILKRCCKGRIIDKTRYIVPYGDLIWEVDEFHSSTSVTTIAEVELSSATIEPELPCFVGKEVTGDPSYYNSNL